MRPGETLTYNGYEVCLFPFDWVECTQISGPGQYSHCCGTASDWVGQTGSRDPIYAPFSCSLIYSGTPANGNTRAYVSDSQVWTPMGLSRIVVAFTHNNNPPSNLHFNQGDLIAHTGTAGNVTGDHCHLDQCTGTTYTLINSGIVCSGGSTCWYLQDGWDPTFVYYLSGGETIVDTLGQQFQTWTTAPGTFAKKLLLLSLNKRKKVLKNAICTSNIRL